MMLLRKWEDLPEFMQTDAVRPYYESLKKRRLYRTVKRVLDVLFSLSALILLLPAMATIAIAVRMDSKGPVIFRQQRVTAYGRLFNIYKFRSMVHHAEALGSQITVQGDSRITKVGGFLRARRLDELPQLMNILKGEMSFVGTRPEVKRYFTAYTDEMMATLLLPAGMTSEASVAYKDESRLLRSADDVDTAYVKLLLPEKMKLNLRSLRHFGFASEFVTVVRTALALCGAAKECADGKLSDAVFMRDDIASGT